MRRIINKMSEEKNQERFIAFGLFLLLIVLLIPLLWISKYNVMAVDDYKYLNIAWNGSYEEEQNILDILLAQMKNAFDCWKTWQGQYFANWSIMSFLALRGAENYFFVTLVTLIPLLSADYALVYVILRKGFDATLSQVCIAVFPVMIYHLSVPASLVEAFYWLSGAVTYTTVYAMSLVSIALLVNLLFIYSKKRRFASYAIVLLLSVCIGGGNFVTGLFMFLVFFFFAAYAFVSRRRHRLFYLINLLIFVMSFLLTIFSPGATNRRIENKESQISAAKAVCLSLLEAVKYVCTWTQPFMILLAAAMLPLFWKLVKKKKYRFPLPALAVLFGFGVYAAQFTPNQYALGILGAYRVQNIYRFQLIFLLLGNEFYILGYLHRRFPLLKFRLLEKLKKVPFITAAYGALATCVVFACMCYYAKDTMSSISTYKSLRNGSAKKYYEEYRERVNILEDDTIEDVVFIPYSCPPYALYFGDFQKSYNWVNEDAAQIYNKNSIRIQ